MNRFLILSIGFLLTLPAQAQIGIAKKEVAKPNIVGRITAVVIDSVSKKPIEYATVSLIKTKNGKTVNGAITDSKGKVIIADVLPDEYKLSVGFIGYAGKTLMVVTTPNKLDASLGKIKLISSTNVLREVNVTGQKNIIESKIDRIVYNAESDATNAGGDATDVMRKVPMLSVDVDGNVQLRGNSVRVLINGKPSGAMANSVADALKMLPADQIKSVEVITNPSAKYDAEGAGGIINIITKKSNAEGVSGNINASAGTRRNSGNYNMTVKTGRFSANTNLGTEFAYPQTTQVFLHNSTTTASGTSNVLQNGVYNWNRQSYYGSLGLDYDFNAYNNISTTAVYNRFYNGGTGALLITNNNLVEKILDQTDKSNRNLDWNVDYKLTGKKPEQEFSVSGQLTDNRNMNNFVNNYQTQQNQLINLLTSSNVGKNKEYTMQTDFVHPFTKSVVFEIGAKGIWRNIISEYGNNTAQNFDYRQNIAAVYNSIRFNLSQKIQFKGGLRAEYTDINFLGADNKLNLNNYFNLFPNVVISTVINGKTTIKLSYNRRVQRPSLNHINPFRNQANQFSVFQGNPELKPELSDNFELGYITFIKGSIINASIFYRRTNNIIENANQVDALDPQKILTTYINVGFSESYGFNILGSYNPMPKWTLMSNIGLNTYEVNGIDPSRDSNPSTGTKLNYAVFFRSATSFKKGWSLDLFGVINSPKYSFQGRTKALFFNGGTIKKEILKKSGAIGFSMLNPLTRELKIQTVNQSSNSYQSKDINYPLRSFGINFSYKFGKLKFTEKKKIKNDDLKPEENPQGEGQMDGGKQRGF